MYVYVVGTSGTQHIHRCHRSFYTGAIGLPRPRDIVIGVAHQIPCYVNELTKMPVPLRSVILGYDLRSR